MSKISIILSLVLAAALMGFIAPSIFAFNRGKILRNIALWLAIFTGLALIYKNFGPGSPMPLVSAPMGPLRLQSAAPPPANQIPANTNGDGSGNGQAPAH